MFIRKPLKYNYELLFPQIDKETMFEHYERHYKTYTDRLNEALQKLSGEKIPQNVVQILKNFSNITDIRNNGGGYLNHEIYFDNISPFRNTFELASEDLRNLIINTFGSYDKFKENFKKAGLSIFGSGWVWLIINENKLKIAITKNQDNPIMSLECNLLLGMDVWEHAYYLKHKSDRSGYIDDFFEIIDWKVVSQRL